MIDADSPRVFTHFASHACALLQSLILHQVRATWPDFVSQIEFIISFQSIVTSEGLFLMLSIG